MELQSHNSVAVLAFSASPAYPRLSRSALRELRELLGIAEQSRVFRGVVVASNSELTPSRDLLEVAAGWAARLAGESSEAEA